MRFTKITDLPDFPGKELLLQAQNRGVEIAGNNPVSAADAELIGLVEILVKSGILQDPHKED